MDASKTVHLVQESQHRWRLESPNGTVIVDNLLLNTLYDAQEWVKAYISSFMGWNYEIIVINNTRGS